MILHELMGINEMVQPLPDDMEPEAMIDALEKRLAAAKRGLSFAHRLKNPLQKKKHFSQVLTNMNMIRGQMSRVIKQLEQFTNASNDYEASNDTNIPAEPFINTN